MEDPKRTPWRSCSSHALMGDLLGVSRYVERDFLFVMSIYRRIFVLLVSSLVRDIVLCLSILVLYSCALVVFVYLSVLAK